MIVVVFLLMELGQLYLTRVVQLLMLDRCERSTVNFMSGQSNLYFSNNNDLIGETCYAIALFMDLNGVILNKVVS